MISVNSDRLGRTVKVDGVVNRGGWFKRYWLVGLAANKCTLLLLVEADYEQHALDEIADSPTWGHWGKVTDEKELAEAQASIEAWGEEQYTIAGNYCDFYAWDIRFIDRVEPADIDWFAKKEY